MTSALLSSRAALRISGPDARSFLQGIVTQDIERLKPGEAAFSALLSPQGKILFDFLMVADSDRFFLDVAADAADALLKRLTLYRLRAKVTITREEGFAVAAFPDGAPPAADGVIAFPDPRLAALGGRAIGPWEKIAALGGADEAAYDAHRIALGVPEFGKDFASDEVFLLDVDYDALGGVSYKKGCFVGQEVTSRMKRKGDVRKRTLIARFEGAPPARGAAIVAGASTIGEIRSGCEGAALALVRLDRLEAARQAGDAPMADRKPLQIVFPDWLEQV
jgi:folate-binding protein YgfZ